GITAALVLALGVGQEPAFSTRVAIRASAVLAVVAATMVATVLMWDAEAAGQLAAANDTARLLEWAAWLSHEATLCLVFLALAAVAIAYTRDAGSHRVAPAVWPIVALAIGGAVLVAAARPIRADILARLADEMESGSRLA